jgi:hypothetical protein
MSSLRDIHALSCPECGQDYALDIQIFCMSRVTADGIDIFGDPDWDHDSSCSCPDCGHCGDVSDFTVGGQP